MPTIIDGYNLIFSCGLEGKSRSPQSLEKARARLIATVAANQNESDRRTTTIVFDAKRLPMKETSADFIVKGIRVLYAIDHEDADSLIEN
jgi:predicted RNA-binding protein with PIN domain